MDAAARKQPAALVSHICQLRLEHEGFWTYCVCISGRLSCCIIVLAAYVLCTLAHLPAACACDVHMCVLCVSLSCCLTYWQLACVYVCVLRAFVLLPNFLSACVRMYILTHVCVLRAFVLVPHLPAGVHLHRGFFTWGSNTLRAALLPPGSPDTGVCVYVW